MTRPFHKPEKRGRLYGIALQIPKEPVRAEDARLWASTLVSGESSAGGQKGAAFQADTASAPGYKK